MKIEHSTYNQGNRKVVAGDIIMSDEKPQGYYLVSRLYTDSELRLIDLLTGIGYATQDVQKKVDSGEYKILDGVLKI